MDEVSALCPVPVIDWRHLGDVEAQYLEQRGLINKEISPECVRRFEKRLRRFRRRQLRSVASEAAVQLSCVVSEWRVADRMMEIGAIAEESGSGGDGGVCADEKCCVAGDCGGKPGLRQSCSLPELCPIPAVNWRAFNPSRSHGSTSAHSRGSSGDLEQQPISNISTTATTSSSPSIIFFRSSPFEPASGKAHKGSPQQQQRQHQQQQQQPPVRHRSSGLPGGPARSAAIDCGRRHLEETTKAALPIGEESKQREISGGKRAKQIERSESARFPLPDCPIPPADWRKLSLPDALCAFPTDTSSGSDGSADCFADGFVDGFGSRKGVEPVTSSRDDEVVSNGGVFRQPIVSAVPSSSASGLDSSGQTDEVDGRDARSCHHVTGSGSSGGVNGEGYGQEGCGNHVLELADQIQATNTAENDRGERGRGDNRECVKEGGTDDSLSATPPSRLRLSLRLAAPFPLVVSRRRAQSERSDLAACSQRPDASSVAAVACGDQRQAGGTAAGPTRSVGDGSRSAAAALGGGHGAAAAATAVDSPHSVADFPMFHSPRFAATGSVASGEVTVTGDASPSGSNHFTATGSSSSIASTSATSSPRRRGSLWHWPSLPASFSATASRLAFTSLASPGSRSPASVTPRSIAPASIAPASSSSLAKRCLKGRVYTPSNGDLMQSPTAEPVPMAGLGTGLPDAWRPSSLLGRRRAKGREEEQQNQQQQRLQRQLTLRSRSCHLQSQPSVSPCVTTPASGEASASEASHKSRKSQRSASSATSLAIRCLRRTLSEPQRPAEKGNSCAGRVGAEREAEVGGGAESVGDGGACVIVREEGQAIEENASAGTGAGKLSIQGEGERDEGEITLETGGAETANGDAGDVATRSGMSESCTLLKPLHFPVQDVVLDTASTVQQRSRKEKGGGVFEKISGAPSSSSTSTNENAVLSRRLSIRRALSQLSLSSLSATSQSSSTCRSSSSSTPQLALSSLSDTSQSSSTCRSKSHCHNSSGPDRCRSGSSITSGFGKDGLVSLGHL